MSTSTFILLIIIGVMVVFLLLARAQEGKERAKQREIGKEKRLKEEEEYKEEQKEEQKEEFLNTVIAFEEKVPEEFRSIWYFLDWSSNDLLFFPYFEEWLDGCNYADFAGYGSKNEFTPTEFDEMGAYCSSLIDRLPYPKCVQKDLDTVARRSDSKEEFHANYSDMIEFFDGKYPDDYADWWESRSEVVQAAEKEAKVREATRRKLGLE